MFRNRACLETFERERLWDKDIRTFLSCALGDLQRACVLCRLERRIGFILVNAATAFSHYPDNRDACHKAILYSANCFYCVLKLTKQSLGCSPSKVSISMTTIRLTEQCGASAAAPLQLSRRQRVALSSPSRRQTLEIGIVLFVELKIGLHSYIVPLWGWSDSAADRLITIAQFPEMKTQKKTKLRWVVIIKGALLPSKLLQQYLKTVVSHKRIGFLCRARAPALLRSATSEQPPPHTCAGTRSNTISFIFEVWYCI